MPSVENSIKFEQYPTYSVYLAINLHINSHVFVVVLSKNIKIKRGRKVFWQKRAGFKHKSLGN